MEIGGCFLPPEMLAAIAAAIRSLRALHAFSLACSATNAAAKLSHFYRGYLSLSEAVRSSLAWIVDRLTYRHGPPFAAPSVRRVELVQALQTNENTSHVVSFLYPVHLPAFWNAAAIAHLFLERTDAYDGGKIFELRSFSVRPPLLQQHIPCYVKDHQEFKKASRIDFHIRCQYHALKGGHIYILQLNMDGIPVLARYNPSEDL